PIARQNQADRAAAQWPPSRPVPGASAWIVPACFVWATAFGRISKRKPKLFVVELYVKPRLTCRSEPIRVRIRALDCCDGPRSYAVLAVSAYLGLSTAPTEASTSRLPTGSIWR